MASIVSGKPAPRHDSPDVTLFREYFRSLAKMVSPEAAAVDLLPILRYVPELCAPWKRLWKRTRKLQRALYFSMLEYAEKKLRSGQKTGSIVENLLEQQLDLGLNREMVA